MADIKWIKITVDMFDDQKIKIIESMPDGDTLLVIWIKLLTLAGKLNADGYVYLTENIAYTEEMLSTVFNRPINTVRLAIKTFEQMNMIEVDENQIIALVNWDKHQSIDAMAKIREQNRIRKQKQRELNKGNVTSHVTVTQSHATELELELELDKEKDKRIITVYEIYQSEIGVLSSLIHEKIDYWLNEFDESIVVHAIKLAAESNVRRWAYIDSILKAWSDKSVKTIDDVKALQADHKRRSTKPSRSSKPKIEVAESTESVTDDDYLAILKKHGVIPDA
jgi:predicted phage replisome organizer